jgi:SpoVK/Ycf46/Vps4 family AAA+-type ATPase
MLDVLLQAEDDEDEPRWRLLILEDTGELLAADAKERTGQGLSRLLNVVDGLIGQGLRVLVLVTTNEEIRKLHPAVARPGRCAADISFSRLTQDEADEWLRTQEAGADAGGRGRTLAELYGLLSGEEARPSEAFGGATS